MKYPLVSDAHLFDSTITFTREKSKSFLMIHCFYFEYTKLTMLVTVYII